MNFVLGINKKELITTIVFILDHVFHHFHSCCLGCPYFEVVASKSYLRRIMTVFPGSGTCDDLDEVGYTMPNKSNCS